MKIIKGVLISIENSDIKDGVLNLPKEVKRIGDKVIQNYNELVEVNAKGLIEIGNGNFDWCLEFKSLNAPILKSIGYWDFAYCPEFIALNTPLLESLGNYNLKHCHPFLEIKTKMKLIKNNW